MYRDRLIYYKDDTAVEVLNAWHPYDYGFEVNYYSDKNLLDVVNDKMKTHDIVYYRLKEEQDRSLHFIHEGAVALEAFLKRILY